MRRDGRRPLTARPLVRVVAVPVDPFTRASQLTRRTNTYSLGLIKPFGFAGSLQTATLHEGAPCRSSIPTRSLSQWLRCPELQFDTPVTIYVRGLQDRLEQRLGFSHLEVLDVIQKAADTRW